MSATSTPVTPEIFEYLINNFSSEDAFLSELQKEAEEMGLPPISISQEQGAFIQFMLKAINAKFVLEIGSLAGYSAITMAKALPEDGKLIAIEKSGKYADFIKGKVKQAGLENIIEVINADARQFLENYQPDFKFDFVFVDADKKAYKYYLDKTTPIIRKGGIFSADNALAFGELVKENPSRNPAEVQAIRDFNLYLNNHDAYQSCLVPVGDGMVMGVKL